MIKYNLNFDDRSKLINCNICKKFNHYQVNNCKFLKFVPNRAKLIKFKNKKNVHNNLE